MPRIFKRKFLVSGFPDLEPSFECSIQQSYLACGDREIRITRRTIKQALVDKMHIKTQETPVGEEIEFSIHNEVFDNIYWLPLKSLLLQNIIDATIYSITN